ncbi:hypothetical protein [Radiobacillus deserti]|uniref:ArsR family transcriptional regulator n=1 Tax=Radiobacillus deserti TaxID=2594883 RepID=A0A516KE10_9BACI|nr:hypothetical protein [Radiobacillus deserti]QDP39546.1 hypothetical protein FN924_04750 [Radiobacillus deserti]
MNNPQAIFPLQLECTLYFETNQYAYETVEGLSLRLGRNAADLVKTLEHLVKLDILQVDGEGLNAVYCYNQPKLVSGVELSWEKS